MIAIDRAASSITFSGNAGRYTVDQMVSIACSVSDALSGIARSTCADINGAAYTFALGATVFSATATDVADNATLATTGIEVIVTFESLANLTREFSSSAAVASTLAQLLGSASRLASLGAVRASRLFVDAYVAVVQRQSGMAFTAEEARILVRLARAL